MLLASAAAEYPSPLEGQKIVLSTSDPCVRLLNATGTVGCATPSRGVLSTLHLLQSPAALSELLQNPPEYAVSVALNASLFSTATLATLRGTLGANLAAVLVLHSATFPSGAESPAPAAVPASGGAAAHAWNAAGSGLSVERFPFAIVGLSAADTATVLTPVAPKQFSPPLLDVRYPMNARENARKCLAKNTCLPLGGQSVWGALQPRTAASAEALGSADAANADGAAAAEEPRAMMGGVDDRPAVGLSAGLDASSFFHELAPGAYAAVSSLVALLAAVDAVAASPTLTAQIPKLPYAPLFFTFAAEAWGETGSRRFLTDVHNFTCRSPAPPSPPARSPAAASSTADGSGSGANQREPLPPPPACDSPYKADMRFKGLGRAKAMHGLIQIGPVGAATAAANPDAPTQLYVHTAVEVSRLGAAASALRAAAPSRVNATVAVTDATRGLGLPPGPAQSFSDPKLALSSSGGSSGSGSGSGSSSDGGGGGGGAGSSSSSSSSGGADVADVATLTDFDSSYHAGGRFGSRFDTLDGLDPTRVCDAAGVAARAWWGLAGGTGEPLPNCTLVNVLLRCLLPPLAASNATAEGAGASSAQQEDGDGAEEEAGASASPPAQPPRCELLSELGMEDNGLTSHYSGVFISSPSQTALSPTAEFARLFLQRTLGRTCATLAPSPTAACEPVVIMHDAYSAGVEPNEVTGGWRTTDADEEVWAESNWPAEMHATIYPHGAPNPWETAFLWAFAVVSSTLTYVAIKFGERQYEKAYVRVKEP